LLFLEHFVADNLLSKAQYKKLKARRKLPGARNLVEHPA
jgi:hypothetical protein